MSIDSITCISSSEGGTSKSQNSITVLSNLSSSNSATTSTVLSYHYNRIVVFHSRSSLGDRLSQSGSRCPNRNLHSLSANFGVDASFSPSSVRASRINQIAVTEYPLYILQVAFDIAPINRYSLRLFSTQLVSVLRISTEPSLFNREMSAPVGIWKLLRPIWHSIEEEKSDVFV